MFRQTDLFESGKGGYHTYRIPALITSTSGTILAFCEGRMHGRGDAGKIDLLLRRSFDGGLTWEAPELVVTDRDMTCGNPCPVVDQSNGTIWLPFCKNLGDGGERLIIEGKAPRTVWLTSSTDDGQTWSDPVEITQVVKDPSWTWYATGPGHGIQLGSGRLVVPCNHVVGVHFRRYQDTYSSHVIYSDDGGDTWRIGGVVNRNVNESVVLEAVDGAIYINCRSMAAEKCRGSAWSWDQGESFTGFAWDDELVEPECQASVIRYTDGRKQDKNRVLFSNPGSTAREKLTIRVSYDECRSWALAKLLNQGPSAYSDLCILPDMTICCLYERGEEHPYERLTFARFDIEWVTDGRDHVDWEMLS